MELPLPFQAIAGLLALILVFWTTRTKVKKTDKAKLPPPEPNGALPLIGHLHLLGGSEPVARTLGSMADKYGPAFMLRLGVNKALVVSSWEAAKECFTTNDKALASRPKLAAAEYLGYDYAMFGFSPYGPYWRELRKIATLEILSNQRLEFLKHVRATEIDEYIKELYNSWVKNGNRPVQVEMKQSFGELTFNIVVMMVAGKRYFGKKITGEEGEARRFRQAMLQFFHLTGVFVPSDALPFLKWVDLKGYLKDMKKTGEELDSLVSCWVEEHRRDRISNRKDDFMDVMLSMSEDAKISGYDQDSVIKATSLGIILGGTDTTAVTLTWALSLLLKNPDVLKKAQDEIDKHIGKERNVEESDIKDLVYLQAICKETMRLYPAAPLSAPHLSMEDCHINGFFVPAGTRILTNLWKLQRDPRVWSDPLDFKPDRFLTDHSNFDVRGKHFEYIPFGSGRRSCPGISFALQVMHLTLACLLRCFDMATPSGQPVDMTESLGITMPKANPLHVLFTPRLPFNLYQQ